MNGFRKTHRWLGLAAAALWLLQAVTGTLLVFRWDLDDATISSVAQPVDPVALTARIEAIEATGATVSSMWASGGSADRFDISSEREGVESTTRIDGAGRVLRNRSTADGAAKGGFWDTIAGLHHNVLGGDIGSWLLGVSGLLLLTNLITGVRLSWPGRLFRAMTRRPTGPAPARAYGWHKLIGLWGAVPAFALVTAGALLNFEDGVERVLGAELAQPDVPKVDRDRSISHADALRRAMALYPGATISGFSLPDDEGRYRVRLNVPGETTRIYGATTVVVSARDGSVLLNHDARQSRGGRLLMETLYPFHTGQIAGTVGRWLVVLTGLWLAVMAWLGVRLWYLRRKPKRSRASSESVAAT